ncbi:DUF6010 family protein [Haliscomenobacter hydrossis]|uniref:Uncharacterized protein n=1 Tax=Haliscomenobacter hydrossis (strain ATCC 27775 / DSM 1100 / LMG 10767 / O) TaxID=760192 RepID=F4L7G7_HALH1|nr:DUF6010 family protein [Haliscomenobacter hydrossis]AEE54147.1 hypothetical protein Halhy_6328 [Haliscomenobacter hydrossis DSM 1100]
MNATLIGISAGVFTLLIFAFFKRLDKDLIYGLILAAIGFLYVGYTWSNISALIMNLLQALFFLMLAYFGVKKNSYYLIAGYFLHGLWDFMYGHVGDPGLIPPDYDWFCSTYDFIIGFYLLMLKFQMNRNVGNG